MPDKPELVKEQKQAPRTTPYERVMAAKLLPIYRRWVADGRPTK